VLKAAPTSSDPVQPDTVWVGTIQQGGRALHTTIRITGRIKSNITGHIHFKGRAGAGRLSFEGTVTDGRIISWITDRLEGEVTFPGLYIGRIENDTIEGEWRVPSWKQYDRFSVKLVK